MSLWPRLAIIALLGSVGLLVVLGAPGSVRDPARPAGLLPVEGVSGQTVPQHALTLTAVPRGSPVTLDQVAHDAVARSAVAFTLLTGQPELALARLVTRDALLDFGYDFAHWAGPVGTPPRALVIVRGDFDISRGTIGTGQLDRASWHWRVKYIAFMYNLSTGQVGPWANSPNGGAFRRALNDYTLPDDGYDALPTMDVARAATPAYSPTPFRSPTPAPSPTPPFPIAALPTLAPSLTASPVATPTRASPTPGATATRTAAATGTATATRTPVPAQP